MTVPTIHLIGAQARLPAGPISAEAMDFYGSLFKRLPHEVKLSGTHSRWLGFRRRLDPGSEQHIFGLEAPPGAAVPDGCTGWTFGQAPTPWRWWAPTAAIGEFSMAGADWWLSALAPFDTTRSLEDEVQVLPYSPLWPTRFSAMADWLRAELGGSIGRIAHYGSTAVPGLAAKPVIDILVEISSFEQARRTLLPRLCGERWEYWWYSDHMLVVRRDCCMGPRTHHLHFAPLDHPVWNGIYVRDYLKSHPGEAARYAQLKAELAAAHAKDREGYTQAKDTFLREILRRLPQLPATSTTLISSR